MKNAISANTAVSLFITSALFALLATDERVSALDQIVIKIASTIPEGTPQAKQLADFKKYITDATEGWVCVKIFTGGSLGDEKTLVERTLKGTIQVFAGPIDALSETVPELSLLQVPYLFRDGKKAARALELTVKKRFATALRNRGLVFGMWMEYGFRSWYTKRGPIRKPADLKGLRLRSRPMDTAQRELFKLFELTPVRLGITEVVENLQRERLDGFESTLIDAAASSWYREVKHLTLSEHSYQPGLVVFSKLWFDGLPEKVKVALQKIPKQTAADARTAVRAMTPTLLDMMEKRGIELYRPTAKERRAFIRSSETIKRTLAVTAGGESWRILRTIRHTR
jgi:TRAP-type C4-dicarboxylate transport system substrate-binding protein